MQCRLLYVQPIFAPSNSHTKFMAVRCCYTLRQSRVTSADDDYYVYKYL